MILTAKVDASAAIAGLNELEKQHLPFALAKTLTLCAKAGQARVQEGLGGKFTLRNTFTMRGIRIKPALKVARRQIADVHTATENRKTGIDYMVKQETGGEKVPHGGSMHIAVPTRFLRMLAGGPSAIIPQELRPRALLGAVAGRYSGTTSKGQIALRPQRITKGYEFWKEEIDGHLAIWGRQVDSREIKPMYWLVPEVKMRDAFHMHADVQKAVDESFPGIWEETWRKMHLKGLRIKS